MRRRRDSVRAISIGIAFLFVLAYTYMKNEGRESVVPPPQSITGRKLLGFGYSSDPSCLNDGSDGGDEDNANCSRPLHQEDSCQFVKDNCGDDVSLFDYLSFIACSVRHVKVCILALERLLLSLSILPFLWPLSHFLPPSLSPLPSSPLTSSPPSLTSFLPPATRICYIIIMASIPYITISYYSKRERERGWHTHTPTY